MALPEHFVAIEKHLDQYFDETDEIVVFDEIKSDDFHLDVYWIKPNKFRKFHLLLTNGVSSLPMNVPNSEFSPYVELAILLPVDWKLENDQWKKPKYYWPILQLKSVGRYAHEHNTWLGFGHTIPEPENETIGSTKCVATILLKSKTLPEDFQRIPYKNHFIEIYLLFPIFASELEYKKANSANALLEKFDRRSVGDIIDLKRRKCI